MDVIKNTTDSNDLENLLTENKDPQSFAGINQGQGQAQGANSTGTFSTNETGQPSKVSIATMLNPELANEWLHKLMKLAGETVYKLSTDKKIDIKWYASEKAGLEPYVKAALEYYNVNFANPGQALLAAVVGTLVMKVGETAIEQKGGRKEGEEPREKQQRRKRRTREEIERDAKKTNVGYDDEKEIEDLEDLTGKKLSFENGGSIKDDKKQKP